LILGDILLSPGKGLMWIFRSIHHAVEDAREQESTNVRAQLTELYQELERGELTEEQFDEQEKVLLDRLDQMKEEEQGAP